MTSLQIFAFLLLCLAIVLGIALAIRERKQIKRAAKIRAETDAAYEAKYGQGGP